jgi:uncharacterized protein
LESSIQAAVHSGHFTSVDDAMTEAASFLLQRLNQTQTEAKPTEAIPAYKRGRMMREGAARYAGRVLSNPGIIVRPQTHQSFLDGFALYQACPDKAYSLTDCIAMEAMRRESITDILTHDNHFTQEGFTTLLKVRSLCLLQVLANGL